MTDRPWNSEKGRLKHLSQEERIAFAKKGNAASVIARRKNKEIKDRLKDKQGMMNAAVAATIANDPEMLENLMASIAQKAIDSDDPKVALAAADMFLKHSGITAPKQVEQKVEDKRSVEDTVDELASLGVNVVGLKVVK